MEVIDSKVFFINSFHIATSHRQVDDTLKTQMNNFLLSTASQQEIQSLDNKIHETVETINGLKTSREFFLSFAKVAL